MHTIVTPAHAGTTTADFLEWERKAQISFLQISIDMVATITSQVHPQIAACINDWYYVDSEQQQSRHDEIIEIMPQYTEYHPSTLVLAVVENACGRIE